MATVATVQFQMREKQAGSFKGSALCPHCSLMSLVRPVQTTLTKVRFNWDEKSGCGTRYGQTPQQAVL